MSEEFQLENEVAVKEERACNFSKDRLYRYSLCIRWQQGGSLVQFVGLNPSTADEQKDDPTIRRCREFAKSFGCSGMYMTNLFAWRDVNPQALKKVPNPVGEIGKFGDFDNFNDWMLWTVGQMSQIKIACWGTKGEWFGRDTKVKKFMTGLQCLRITTKGFPEHPLYLPATCRPMEIPP